MTSNYDSGRDTVGKIYIDAQLNNTDQYVINGDLTNELTKSLVDDINDTVVAGTKEFEGKIFYITVHENKDLQMPKAIKRRMVKTPFRPWPEDDTIVFKVIPSCSDVRFCWCLPHRNEMYNMTMNPFLFDKEMIRDIKAWEAFDLPHFGFTKDEIGNWVPNPHAQDREMKKRSIVMTESSCAS